MGDLSNVNVIKTNIKYRKKTLKVLQKQYVDVSPLVNNNSFY